ncbi:MAG: SGNH/GDSL hydrolase family protein, partial [Clostridia bacterium]|nr:SGNH/GDSL hydrolase family protein [Clostridia bacterium]
SRKEAYLKAILEKGSLPKVSGSDNGKVLSVVNGEWGAANIPEGNLPAVTSADNGRFLRVSNGSWGNDEFPEFDRVRKNTYSIKADGLTKAFVKNSGALQNNDSYRVTGLIPVKKDEQFEYKLSHGSSALPIIAFYDASGAYDGDESVKGANEGYKSGTYTVPTDGFVRLVYHTSYSDVYAVFTSEIPDNVRAYVNDRTRVERTWGLNVLLLGDSIFGNDGEIRAFIGEYCGSCVNGAFGGTRVSVRTDDPNWKYFDGENIVTALTTGVWTDQDAAAAALSSSYPWITGRLAGLKAVDMSTVDVIIMDWGTNDYTAAQTIQTITEAYGSVIDKLQSAFPSVRLLISTPIWRYFSNSENGDNKTFTPAACTLKEIAAAIEELAGDKRISVLNAYRNMPLSYATASTYFDTGDKTHLNTAGNRVYAGLLTGKLRTMF